MCIHECSEEHSLHLLYSCLCIVLKKVRLQVITDTPFFVRYAGASKGHNCVERCFLQERHDLLGEEICLARLPVF